MKILKIFLIVLIPAMGFVGCQKSQLKPGCAEHPANTATAPDATDDSQNVSSRFGDMSDSGSEGEEVSNSGEEVKIGTSVVGSGDDDREGGDKKRKR